jgi:hypothetical protein
VPGGEERLRETTMALREGGRPFTRRETMSEEIIYCDCKDCYDPAVHELLASIDSHDDPDESEVLFLCEYHCPSEGMTKGWYNAHFDQKLSNDWLRQASKGVRRRTLLNNRRLHGLEVA